MKPILLIKTGSTIADIVPKHGDFEDWFEAGLGVNGLTTIEVFRGQPLPRHDRFAGVVITGSAAMVSDREPWSEDTADWLRDVVAGGLPVLGVCYGHQLLAHALGGRVGPNPAGREMGTVEIRLEPAVKDDPLLSGLPRHFRANSSHLETVLELPGGAQCLARSSLDVFQAVRFGGLAWGVQFHPEFSADVMREYIRLRAAALRKEKLDSEVLLAGVGETPQAGSLLGAFMAIVTEAARAPAA